LIHPLLLLGWLGKLRQFAPNYYFTNNIKIIFGKKNLKDFNLLHNISEIENIFQKNCNLFGFL